MARYSQEFVVQGRIDFPFDMLRYDYCYPADTESAVYMGCASDVAKDAGQCSVRLRRTVDRKDIKPTAGRWASFGWSVVPESIRQIKI